MHLAKLQNVFVQLSMRLRFQNYIMDLLFGDPGVPLAKCIQDILQYILQKRFAIWKDTFCKS